MSLLLILIGILVAGSLGLLLWAAGHGSASPKQQGINSLVPDLNCEHVTNLSQIRQALDAKDLEYISGKLPSSKTRRFRKERSQVVLKYLRGLKEDFDRLIDTAQIVASLSPEVEAKEEWKRFKLAARFRLNYEMARIKFTVGSPAFPKLENLANILTSLEMDLERVMTEITLSGLTPGESGSAQG